MITGTVLLAFAASWALLATLSMLWTEQPQRWAVAARWLHGGWPAPVFSRSRRAARSSTRSAGSGRRCCLRFSPRPSFAPIGICTAARASGSCTRCWLSTRSALLAAAIKRSASRSTAARIRHPASWSTSADTGFICTVLGSGTPTVILESGLGEAGAYWGWISTAVARDTRVCVYDRAGRGWSDPAAVAAGRVAVATDLHILLDRAHVTGPFVLVGHSSGAQYVRIFAGRYPEQVAGMVLLDGQPAEAFEGLPIFPVFYSVFPPRLRVVAVAGSPRRRADCSTTPALTACPRKPATCSVSPTRRPARPAACATSSPSCPHRWRRPDRFRASATGRWSSSPLRRIAMAGWLPLQDRMATLSTNSSHRVVPYTHDALVTDQTAAQTSIAAIRDVVHAVRFNVPLEKP